MRFASDLVVDMLAALGIEHVALNPGASFRGLHDSLVHSEGAPGIVQVPHEEIAVGMAHGYAKATGRPMGVAVHDVVGLLHASMALYYAYTDRAPMLVIGGTGPMDQAKRRSWIDWVHTANVENEAVRAFTKWDDRLVSAEAIPSSLTRAWKAACRQPQGPVYVALDAALQEEALGETRPERRPETRPVPFRVPLLPSRIGPDPEALERLARTLVAAQRPVAVAGYVGRDPECWALLVDLAELLGMGVVDTNLRSNFPNRHPLNVTGTPAIGDADVILLLDVKDVGDHGGIVDKRTRGLAAPFPDGATVLDLGFDDLGLSSWASDYGAAYQADQTVLADTALALPLLLARCRELVAREPARRSARETRSRDLAQLHRTAWAAWRAKADEARDSSLPRLAAEVWDAVSGYDWVLSAGTAQEWALRLWDFDRPGRHLGRSLGTATQIGISLGAALSAKDTGKVVVDLQPDGDLLYDAGALWVASRYQLPLLVVMVDNRAYGNDLLHQREMARQRGRPLEKATTGVSFDEAPPDYATLARSFGWPAWGPVEKPNEIAKSVRAAADVVATTGGPALVDVVCAPP